MTIEEKEELYLRAKAEYYKGNEIMSDFEFDTLEEELKAEGSSVVFVVDGDDTVGTRYPHMNPMLSLEKVQVMDENEFPLEDLQKFFDKAGQIIPVEGSPKLDGSAMSLKYVDGILKQGLTRGGGDKKGGLDKTDKMRYMVPETIEVLGTVEVRGEIVIDKEVFAKKYAHEYKNERNFVAGIMNKDEDWEEFIEDFKFVAYHLVLNADTAPEHAVNTMETLHVLGFNVYHNPLTFICDSAQDFFDNVYPEFKKYREEESPYRLDGIVLKFPEEIRHEFGENSHHPKWAVAIKFPPEEQITTIKDIIWQLGPSGVMTPIADLEPINLDGTTVKHASLHNFGKIKENECWPGAKVIVAKKGDIIPQIIKVVEGALTESEIPCSCPTCNTELAILKSKQAEQLYCPNDECEGKGVMRLAQGIKILGIERIGGATAEDLYNAGILSVHDLFDDTLFCKAHLIESGIFKKGRALDIVLDGVYDMKKKPIRIDQVINSLKFTDSGSSISREVGKFMSGVSYDFKGFNKEVVKKLTTEGTVENEKIKNFISILEDAGVTVERFTEEVISEDIMFCEMTGSPKPFFATKKDFTDFALEKNFKHSKLNTECKYLLTDSYTSSSSKMKKATKLGVEIITYEDFKNKHA